MIAPHPDTRFLTSLTSNDHLGIEEIYTQFAVRIQRFVEANNGNTDDARDLFQEALIAISRQARRPSFTLTCPFGAYLYCVCRGKWLNELKRRQRAAVTIREAGGFTDMETGGELAEATLREETRDRLFLQSFEKLSAGCRQLLRLSWSGISMEEVSKELGISYNYARKKKHECVSQLIARIRNTPEYAQMKSE